MNFIFLKKVVSLFIMVVLFSACGYSPSSKFAKATLGDKISTSIIVSEEDPQNSVIIKDAVDLAIIKVFQASLVERGQGDTHLSIKMGVPSYSPVIYDANGYVTGYRMNMSLNIKSSNSGKSNQYQVRGTHDFSVAPNAIVTDQQRFEAIDISTQKAIRAFLAKVSADGARSTK
ncbi:hypothetical protein N9A28_05565 [Sulfurimonas sp.]|nr:hypothetical protein [Sulfurimonas sp.]